MVGDLNLRNSTLGYLITFVGGGWGNFMALQKCIALSTTQAKYITTKEAQYISIIKLVKKSLLM